MTQTRSSYNYYRLIKRHNQAIIKTAENVYTQKLKEFKATTLKEAEPTVEGILKAWSLIDSKEKELKKEKDTFLAERIKDPYIVIDVANRAYRSFQYPD